MSDAAASACASASASAQDDNAFLHLLGVAHGALLPLVGMCDAGALRASCKAARALVAARRWDWRDWPVAMGRTYAKPVYLSLPNLRRCVAAFPHTRQQCTDWYASDEFESSTFVDDVFAAAAGVEGFYSKSCRFDDLYARQVVARLHLLPQLRVLFLEGRLGRKASQDLFAVLRKLPLLERLSIQLYDDADGAVLVEALSVLPRLAWLKVSVHESDVFVALATAAAAGSLRRLHTLVLSAEVFDCAVVASLVRNLPCLKHLYLDGDAENPQALAAALAEAPYLEGFGADADAGDTCMAEALCARPPTAAGLRSFAWRGEGDAVAVTALLARSAATLTDLNLSWSLFAPQFMSVRPLAAMVQLTRLWLYGVEMTADEYAQLVAILPTLPKLTMLDLGGFLGGRPESFRCDAIVPQLPRMRRLERVCLDYLSAEAYAELARVAVSGQVPLLRAVVVPECTYSAQWPGRVRWYNI